MFANTKFRKNQHHIFCMFFSDFFIRYTFCNYLRPERGKQCISIFQNFVVIQKKYLKKYEKFSKNYVKNYRFNLQIPQCVCKNI